MIPMRITCYHVLEECFPNITKIIPNTLVGSERKKKKIIWKIFSRNMHFHKYSQMLRVPFLSLNSGGVNEKTKSFEYSQNKRIVER